MLAHISSSSSSHTRAPLPRSPGNPQWSCERKEPERHHHIHLLPCFSWDARTASGSSGVAFAFPRGEDEPPPQGKDPSLPVLKVEY